MASLHLPMSMLLLVVAVALLSTDAQQLPKLPNLPTLSKSLKDNTNDPNQAKAREAIKNTLSKFGDISKLLRSAPKSHPSKSGSHPVPTLYNQASGSSVFNTLAKSLNIDVSKLSASCRRDAGTANAQCFSEISSCIKAHNLGAAACGNVMTHCTKRCTGNTNCTVALHLLVTTPLHLKAGVCMPASCGGAHLRSTLIALNKAIYAKASAIALQKTLVYNPIEKSVMTCSHGSSSCDSYACTFASIGSSTAAGHAGQNSTLNKAKQQQQQHKTQNAHGSGGHRAHGAAPDGVRTARPYPGRAVTHKPAQQKYPGLNSRSQLVCDESQVCGKCHSDSVCCHIGDFKIGCTSEAVAELLGELFEQDLSQVTAQCQVELLVEKRQCIKTYEQCITQAEGLLPLAASQARLLGKAPSAALLVSRLGACTKLGQCLTETGQGDAAVGPHVPGTFRSGSCNTSVTYYAAESSRPSTYNASLMLPRSCQTHGNLNVIAQAVGRIICSPLCLLAEQLEALGIDSSELPAGLDLSQCPVDRVSFHCTSQGKTSASTHYPQVESCPSLEPLLEPFFPEPVDNNLNKVKVSVWEDKWFIVGVVTSGIVGFGLLVMLLRWRMTVTRRRQAQTFTYATLNDDMVVSAVE
ncbi:uncharacterized protein LOC135829528 [Sycon ciliatum]|uniref:uncharacterized protein LOC135829528 n=1 Tax=Sycon ciliatum TaxID=27933 RepID=UPI0031F61BFB|eukprot:scpid86020/ scgid4867/ 